MKTCDKVHNRIWAYKGLLVSEIAFMIEFNEPNNKIVDILLNFMIIMLNSKQLQIHLPNLLLLENGFQYPSTFAFILV